MPSQFKNIEIQDTGYLTLPSGTSAERPSQPESGMIRYNTDLGKTEWYDSDDSEWKSLSDTFPRATGGTVVDTEINGRPYRLHYFTETGTDTLTVTAGGEIEYLIVAGGGSGACGRDDSRTPGGGGGAGGVLTGRTSVFSGNISILIGAGGSSVGGSSVATRTGNRGENSSFDSLVSLGGQPGLNNDSDTPRDFEQGGSGGGRSGGGVITSGFIEGGLAGSNGFFANNGGDKGPLNSNANSGNAGGGGGGAGAVGQDASQNNGGNGGAGISSTITGSVQFYAGGGGGAGDSAGIGGAGGGGAGSNDSSDGIAGGQNTGGGGGGNRTSGNSGAGGSGIVIVRYPRDPDATYSQPDRTISSTLPGNFNIIEDGLILNLDAGNPASYPGSGSTWRDLGQGTDGTISGAGFSVDNGGYFEFDGTDDIITGSLSSEPEDVTLEGWVKTPGESGAGIIGYGTGDTYKEVWLEINGNGNAKIGFYSDDIAGGFPANNTQNQWVYIAGTINNLLQTVYVNGELIDTNQGSNTFTGGTSYRIGKGRDSGGEFFKGNIAIARIYNRALSEQEIRHNFNVTRGRFGV